MRLRILCLLPIFLGLGCAALPAGPVDETASRTLLQQAAKHLDAGDQPAALPCLTQYVEQNPEHATIRAHLAELLIRLDKPAEARTHLERYVADAQLQGDVASKHLVHSHTRLVEIAASQGDEFAEHLYRGVGLFLIGEGVLKADADDDNAQRILFKAIAELKLAAARRPDEARPQWYLHQCWSHLGQSQPARIHLVRARRLAPLGGLTPAEREELALAE